MLLIKKHGTKLLSFSTEKIVYTFSLMTKTIEIIETC